MSIVRANLLIVALGLSLVAGQVKAGLFCGSDVEAIKNSPEYKIGAFVVAGAGLPKQAALAIGKALKDGAVQLKTDWVTNPRYKTYAKACLAAYGVAVVTTAVILAAGKVVDKIKEAKARRKISVCSAGCSGD